ncbi:hypothetical protein KKF61_07200 [Patescibacteria group bacterium]|nr:hypothetical protein [Patescibacteria group bacterium]MBU1082842.1 hypothetical protein [Patescibacteria group bacterium]
MTNEKWGEILDKVLASFEVISHNKTKEDIAEIEEIVFNGPLGKMKLVHTSRPAVLDKKVVGAYRRGKSAAQYEYVYSDTDTVSSLAAFREVDGEWQEIDAESFN